MKKNIILIGYMGCGKTTVGKSLARLESAIFLDTDERIEEKQGRESALCGDADSALQPAILQQFLIVSQKPLSMQ